MIYETPPSDFKKQVDVVGCYVQHDGKFVLLHRPPHKWSGNLWGLPAGKTEPGESLEAAMRREIREETGLDVEEGRIKRFRSVAVRHDTFDFQYHMFSLDCDTLPDITINRHEHDDVKWVTPQEALEMPMVRDQDECVRLFYRIKTSP